MQEARDVSQVIITGLPGAGKEHVLNSLTESTVVEGISISPARGSPFRIMRFEDIQIRMIKAPVAEGEDRGLLLKDTRACADLVIIIIDLSREPLSQVRSSLQGLVGCGVEPKARAFGEIAFGQRSQSILIVGNKDDVAGANNNWYILHSQYAMHFPMIAISAREGRGMADLKKVIYELVGVIRIYLKDMSSDVAQDKPLMLRKGTTVKELFQSMHKRDLCPRLNYAIIWNPDRCAGQRAGKKHVLQDKDVVEFHLF